MKFSLMLASLSLALLSCSGGDKDKELGAGARNAAIGPNLIANDFVPSKVVKKDEVQVGRPKLKLAFTVKNDSDPTAGKKAEKPITVRVYGTTQKPTGYATAGKWREEEAEFRQTVELDSLEAGKAVPVEVVFDKRVRDGVRPDGTQGDQEHFYFGIVIAHAGKEGFFIFDVGAEKL